VGFAGNRRLQIVAGAADGQSGGRIAHRFEILQVSVGVAGLAFRGGAEDRGHVIVALHIGLAGEVEIAAVGLRLACECVLQILFGAAAFQIHRVTP